MISIRYSYNTPMDITQLRAFVAVAHEGNLTRAAEKLHVTQPAVSLQIKSLQAALELQLFNRNTAGMSLTEDGAKLLPYAERVLAAFTGSSRATPSARPWQSDASGQSWQRGVPWGRQIVAPRSISAWLKSPGRSTGIRRKTSASIARRRAGSPTSAPLAARRANTRSTLPSTAGAGTP